MNSQNEITTDVGDFLKSLSAEENLLLTRVLPTEDRAEFEESVEDISERSRKSVELRLKIQQRAGRFDVSLQSYRIAMRKFLDA